MDRFFLIDNLSYNNYLEKSTTFKCSQDFQTWANPWIIREDLTSSPTTKPKMSNIGRPHREPLKRFVTHSHASPHPAIKLRNSSNNSASQTRKGRLQQKSQTQFPPTQLPIKPIFKDLYSLIRKNLSKETQTRDDPTQTSCQNLIFILSLPPSYKTQQTMLFWKCI